MINHSWQTHWAWGMELHVCQILLRRHLAPLVYPSEHTVVPAPHGSGGHEQPFPFTSLSKGDTTWRVGSVLLGPQRTAFPESHYQCCLKRNRIKVDEVCCCHDFLPFKISFFFFLFFPKKLLGKTHPVWPPGQGWLQQYPGNADRGFCAGNETPRCGQCVGLEATGSVQRSFQHSRLVFWGSQKSHSLEPV